MGVTPRNAPGFELAAEGPALVQVESIDWKFGNKTNPEDTSIVSAQVKMVIVDTKSGDSIDLPVNEYYYNLTETKKTHTLERFLWMLHKSVGMPIKEYEVDHFADESNRAKISKKLPGTTFGIDIKHQKDKEGGVFAKIKECYTKDEYKALLKPGNGGMPKSEPAKQEAKATSSSDDDWS